MPKISNEITTNYPQDLYPTHLAELGKGGLKSVKTIADRDAIPYARLEEGSIVCVLNDNTNGGAITYYSLKTNSRVSAQRVWTRLNFETAGQPVPIINATAEFEEGTEEDDLSVEVTKDGDNATPSFNFKFKGKNGLKGEQGERGERGAQGIQGEPAKVPVITVNAHASAAGETGVTVKKHGDDEAPTFTFFFKGLKGHEDFFGLPLKYKKITDYLYKFDYTNLDYNFAERAISGDYNIGIPFGCSSVFKDGIFGRNFDWTWNNELEVVVETQDNNVIFGSIAVCGGLPKLTKKNIENKSLNKDDLKLLPFYVRDGINSRGLACSINVVPAQGNTRTVPTKQIEKTISSTYLLRFILDNFDEAELACQYIKENVEIVIPESLIELGYEVHYLIADDNQKCFYLEIKDNEVVYDTFTTPAVLTNFRYHDVNFLNNKVYTPETGKANLDQNVELYGQGLERFNIIVDGLDNATDSETMYTEVLKKVLYSQCYNLDNTWYTEFTSLSEKYGDLNVDSIPSDFDEIKSDFFQKSLEQVSEEDKRKAKSLWKTTHSSVYDLEKRSLELRVDEKDEVYRFQIKSLAIEAIDNIPEVDDSTISRYKTWSSTKTQIQINKKAQIDDLSIKNSSTWSSEKINKIFNSLTGADVGEFATKHDLHDKLNTSLYLDEKKEFAKKADLNNLVSKEEVRALILEILDEYLAKDTPDENPDDVDNPDLTD